LRFHFEIGFTIYVIESEWTGGHTDDHMKLLKEGCNPRRL
jgi:hypothetical protein